MSRWLLVAAVLCACGRSDDKAKPGMFGAADITPRDVVVDAWKKAGLTLSPMTPAAVAFAKDCQSGTVGAVDVLVCLFPSAAEAKAAEDPGLGWVGDTTGASQAHGGLLIVAADRRKSDPSGRTINQMMKLAPK